MTFSALIECLQVLSQSGVRYMVVGGFAVVAHGYRRMPCLETLIQMKLLAGREKDLRDVEALRRLNG